jgi:hypothetical protein
VRGEGVGVGVWPTAAHTADNTRATVSDPRMQPRRIAAWKQALYTQ